MISHLSATLKHIRADLPSGHVSRWYFIWCKSKPKMCSIGVGWYEFVRNYPLDVGDKVTIRVITDATEEKHLDIRVEKGLDFAIF